MATSPVGFVNGILGAQNADFSGAAATVKANGLVADGKFWIGRTTPNANGTNIDVGTIASTSLTVGYSNPNITLEVAASNGFVVGPASATDNALARFDLTTGKIIQNGVITEDDTGNLSQSAAVSGASLSVITSNTSNTASATAFHQVQVAGATASDAYYRCNISGGQSWIHGLDNSDGDAWALSSSATLGTTNVMRASTAGEINYPLQPAFSAYQNATASNVTGDGTNYTVIFDTEIADQNADYNNATGVFTAPVTGLVTLTAGVRLSGLGVANTGGSLSISTSNGSYFPFNANVGTMRELASGGNALSMCISALADMDAADVASIVATVTGATKIVNVVGAGRGFTYFTGNLEC